MRRTTIADAHTYVTYYWSRVWFRLHTFNVRQRSLEIDKVYYQVSIVILEVLSQIYQSCCIDLTFVVQ